MPSGVTVLDVACGHGRHSKFLAARGCRVSAVDRDAAALETLRGVGEIIGADIENGPWPFSGRKFGAVVVTNYLWRPLLPLIVDCVGDDGVLLYETFAAGNGQFGKPSRPDFLLQPGELLRACESLDVIAYEHGMLENPARIVQRLAACGKGRGAQSLESAIPGKKFS